LVAKIATDIGKIKKRGTGPPNAITVVPPGTEAAFLAPLPVEALWGVGPKTAERLETLGILTIGDLARQSPLEFARLFGKIGPEMLQRAQGIDDSPIVTSHEVKSISQETTFSHDVSDEAMLRRTLTELSESVGQRLRESQLKGSTVKLKLRWPDFTTLTRQVTLPKPTDRDQDLQVAAIQLFMKVWHRGRAVRLLGVGISGFEAPTKQLSLWELPSRKENEVQEILNILQQKFGTQAIRRGQPGKPHDR
jgi:DNA polymerase-4